MPRPAARLDPGGFGTPGMDSLRQFAGRQARQPDTSPIGKCPYPRVRRLNSRVNFQERKASMIAIIFEVWPVPGKRQTYLDIAAALRPQLEKIEGFVSIERFESLARPGKALHGATAGPRRCVRRLSPAGGAGAARLRNERPRPGTGGQPQPARLSKSPLPNRVQIQCADLHHGLAALDVRGCICPEPNFKCPCRCTGLRCTVKIMG